MRLRSQMNHAIYAISFKTSGQAVKIAYVDLFESIVCGLLDSCEVLEIPGVSQAIDVHEQVILILRDQMEQQVRSNKARPSRDNDSP
jgi:hypothetical protein